MKEPSLRNTALIAALLQAFVTTCLAQKASDAGAILKSHDGLAKELQALKLSRENLKSISVTRGELDSKVRKREEDNLNNILRQSLAAASSIYLNDGQNGTPRIIGRTLDGKPIYRGYGLEDGDSRRNLDDPAVTKQQIQAARATLAIVYANKFRASPDGKTLSLPSVNAMPNGLGLCTPEQSRKLKLPVERFFDEANPAHCSAFKVGPRLIATAAHCMKSEEVCKGSRFVVGFYKSKAKPRPETNIPVSNVYECKRILAREFSDNGADWAIVESDREIAAPAVSIRTTDEGVPAVGEGVTVIGYPMGLPGKIADGATIRSTEEKYFVANLDTYGGNSGSAVFNTKKLVDGKLYVEGILVRGEDDFAQTSPCFASKYCPIAGCRGEDVVYAKDFQAALAAAKARLAEVDPIGPTKLANASRH